MTILVVDDEPIVLAFVDRVLRGAGYSTVLASNGAEALEIAGSSRFELLLTDVVMPEMTGDELARRVRQFDPALKVLYLTGYSDWLFQENTTLREGEAFLEKPFSSTGLLEAISLLLFDHIRGLQDP